MVTVVVAAAAVVVVVYQHEIIRGRQGGLFRIQGSVQVLLISFQGGVVVELDEEGLGNPKPNITLGELGPGIPGQSGIAPHWALLNAQKSSNNLT